MGGDDFNKSNTNRHNTGKMVRDDFNKSHPTLKTGKSIDELKRIVRENRNVESLGIAEQVNAMFERILETGDIENKIMEKMTHILDQNFVEQSSLVEQSSRPPHVSSHNYIQISFKFHNIWYLRMSPYGLFMMPDSQLRVKHYNEICQKLQKHIEGISCVLIEGGQIKPAWPPSPNPPWLNLTVSW